MYVIDYERQGGLNTKGDNEENDAMSYYIFHKKFVSWPNGILKKTLSQVIKCARLHFYEPANAATQGLYQHHEIQTEWVVHRDFPQ